MPERVCPICQRIVPLEEFQVPVGDRSPLLEFIDRNNPRWSPAEGLCQECLGTYERLLAELRRYHPQGADERFWIIPVPVRLEADPRFTGRGVTIAFLDSGYYLHPDLLEPENRVLGYVNILSESVEPDELWKEVTEPHVDAWHGMMTSVVAAGNGYLSQGFYRGIAHQANVVLIKVGSASRIHHDDIRRGIEWVIEHKEQYGIRILNVSCGGDYEVSYLTDPLSQSAEAAVRAGIVVVAAAGNKGHEPGHPVIPPASAPAVITVGGLDDNNHIDWSGYRLYHSSYGPTIDGLQKPEVIAPSIWLAAPILPGTQVADQARLLEELSHAPVRQFKTILQKHPGVEPRLAAAAARPVRELRGLVRDLRRANNLISADYKHVDGTSFAAPIVSSIVAQMLEASPALTPQQVKLALIRTARRLPHYDVDKQGWGVISARQAVERALELATLPDSATTKGNPKSQIPNPDGLEFGAWSLEFPP
jgi:serine protease AprX